MRGHLYRTWNRLALWSKAGALGIVICGIAGTAALAQDSTKAAFRPVKIVNNHMVTGYELSQRMGFLKLLGVKGDLREQAITGLIDDRLRSAAAKRMGISLSSEAVIAGMEEFAARGSLSAEELVQMIGDQGIAAETFRDFVSAGIVWREVIKARYSDTFEISDAAVDRALNNLQVGDAQTVTLAEIVLDASGPNRNAALTLARNLQIDFIKGRAFSDAARKVSTAPSARKGGALAAQKLSELPEQIAVLVRGLSPGQISTPIIKDDRLYIYQKLSDGAVPVARTGGSVVDYAEIKLASGANGADQIAKMRTEVDTCDDLFAYSAAQRGMSVSRQTAAKSDVAGALQLLDAGEISPLLPGGRAVMLCARGLKSTQTASRDEVRLALKNQRLGALAEVYLSELRADALIRDP